VNFRLCHKQLLQQLQEMLQSAITKNALLSVQTLFKDPDRFGLLSSVNAFNDEMPASCVSGIVPRKAFVSKFNVCNWGNTGSPICT
jgi:hypothetical protein